MCEYCDTDDIDRGEVFRAIRYFNGMDSNAIVPLYVVSNTMGSVYRDRGLAESAIQRLNTENACVTRGGVNGIPARDVVSKLELLVACRGHSGVILDG